MDARADSCPQAGRRVLQHAALLTVAIALLAWYAPAAFAAPAWRIDALANTTAAPGATLTILVEVRNIGTDVADGSAEAISFTGAVPPGLTVQSVTTPLGAGWDCSSVVMGAQTFSCQYFGMVGAAAPENFRRFAIEALVDSGASGIATTSLEITGGGAPAASIVAPATVTDAPLVFDIAAFDAEVTADAAGTPFTQAGGHPFAATTSIDFTTYRNPEPFKGDATPVEAVKDIEVDLPPGFFGDPTGVDRCTLPQLANTAFTSAMPLCPPSSQVGTTIVRSNGTLGGRLVFGPLPVFNMEPPVNAPARLGFNVAGTIVTLDVTLRTGSDYGLTAHLRNISEGLAVASSSFTLWGVPADPAHDRERACPGIQAPWDGGPSCTSGAPRVAFLRNPTSCPVPGVGLPTTLRMDSWVDPGDWRERTIFSHMPNGYPFPPAEWGPLQGPTNCAGVPFDPKLRVTPDSTAAARPSGYSFDVTLPQTDEPEVTGQSDLKRAVVTLPLGVTFSTSATAGLEGCSPAQIALRSEADPVCPEASKLGSVSITTPALEDPVEGSIYLAGSRDNPFDSLIALYLVARGQGVLIKLAGEVKLDPLTGQVTTVFDDNPQAPFSRLHLEFKGGPRAPIVNPRACGVYTTRAEFTGWSGAIVNTDSSFEITAPCGGAKFTPSFSAGTESSSAGRSSPLHVRFTREDDDEELAAVTVDMPSGLTGKIAETTLCSNAEANAGSCGEASKIGSVTVGAGAGPNPFYITNGRAYITGPYKGAPFGLSVVVPAIAGPFNLGNVVVRSAIFVDKHDATLRVVSDALPTKLEGVTIGVRDVRIVVDRPGFTINPTNCSEKRIEGVITSAIGQRAAVSERFEALDCHALNLKPSMRLVIGAPGRTGRGASTPFQTTLRMPAAGNANLRSVKVSLPTTINARLPVINRACTREAYEAGRCESARAGTAVAKTPLLRDELHGNVYFVRNGRPLPDMFISLRGQVSFDLIGRVSIPGGKRLATTFDAVPDVPVTSFTLRLVAGRQGPVGAATNLCTRRGRSAKAELDFIGQNGKVRQVDQRLVIRGCGQRATRNRRGNRGRGSANRRGR